MISTKTNDNFDISVINETLLDEYSYESCLFGLLRWMFDNHDRIIITQRYFVIKSDELDLEVKPIVKILCYLTGCSLSFYYSDIDNQWILDLSSFKKQLFEIRNLFQN